MNHGEHGVHGEKPGNNGIVRRSPLRPFAILELMAFRTFSVFFVPSVVKRI
jgi:hypothetical protein